MDTPGMRELELGDHDAGLSEFCSEVNAIACRCRFTDCHKEDLGEAVREKERWKWIHQQARQHVRRKGWGEEER